MPFDLASAELAGRLCDQWQAEKMSQPPRPVSPSRSSPPPLHSVRAPWGVSSRAEKAGDPIPSLPCPPTTPPSPQATNLSAAVLIVALGRVDLYLKASQLIRDFAGVGGPYAAFRYDLILQVRPEVAPLKADPA